VRRDPTRSKLYEVGCAFVGVVLLTVSLLVASSARPSDRELDLSTRIDDLSRAVDALLFPATAGAGLVLPVVVMVAAAIWARSIRLAVLSVAAGLVSFLLAELLKRVVERGRPCAFIDQTPCDELGFPSATTAIAFAVATTVAGVLPRGLAVVAFVLAALVGCGRVLVGEHLAADVVGGAGIGLIVGAAVFAVGGAAGVTGDRSGSP
jgi:membrane-associated phospholipid phosphatase